MIYFAFVYSQLSYGIKIYGNTHSTYLNSLMVLNNKLLRILQNVARDTHVIDLYYNYNTLALPDLHKYYILLFMHRFFHHKELPHIFSTYFVQNAEIHSHNTRTKEEPHVKLFSSTFGQRSIKYKGPHLWSSLPEQFISFSSTIFHLEIFGQF